MKFRNFRATQPLPIALLCIAVVSACSLFIMKSDRTDNALQARDIAQTDQEMTGARNTLMPLLQPLGVRLGTRNPATCTEGDPSLYAHSCGSQTTAVYDVNISSLSNGDVLSQKLQTLDMSLKSSGWKYGFNDFRSSEMRPVNTWTSILRAYGARVAYTNKNCSFEIFIWSSETPEKDHSAYPGSLSCYITSGPARSP